MEDPVDVDNRTHPYRLFDAQQKVDPDRRSVTVGWYLTETKDAKHK